jgi:dihydroorotate dehydrogenase electron transfer subunit
MNHIQLEILEQREAAHEYFEMTLRWPKEIDGPVPGQFFTVRTSSGPAPLLRRPFAFSAFDEIKSTVRFLYQRRGSATHLLAGMVKGDFLDILAPLGTTFPLEKYLVQDKRPLLIAGGVGTGPMLYCASWAEKKNPLLIIGARDRCLLPFSVIPTGTDTILCTEDGSYGIQGTVLDAADSQKADSFSAVFACGPNRMLKAVHDWSVNKKIDCYVSMEQTMGCAVGACMGCTIPMIGKKPFARVCMEGPVFDSRTINWEGLLNA